MIDATDDYIVKHNDDPKPFIWTKNASDKLEKVKHAHQALINAQRLAAVH